MSDPPEDRIQTEVREKLKKFLQASIVACGSDGSTIKKFMGDFREDWQKPLTQYAKDLGFEENQAGVLAMLKTFPSEVIVEEQPTGQTMLKPIANEQTKENLNLIDTTNKEMAKERASRFRFSTSHPNPNLTPLSQFAAFRMPAINPRVAPAPTIPKKRAKQPVKVIKLGPPPPVPGPKQSSNNANLEPLGTRPLSTCRRSSNQAEEQQRSRSSSAKTRENFVLSSRAGPPHGYGNVPPGFNTIAPISSSMAARNDFGDALQRQCINLCTNRQFRSKTPAKEGKPVDTDMRRQYEDERDFQVPPSHHSTESSLPQSRLNNWQEREREYQGHSGALSEGGQDEDEFYCSDEAESDWDIDVGEIQSDDKQRCTAFLSQDFDSIPHLADMRTDVSSSFCKGDRYTVQMTSYSASDKWYKLRLTQLEARLKDLLCAYLQIMETVADEEPILEPKKNQGVFFIAAGKHLCRGRFVRPDGGERAVVRDIDTGLERYVPVEDIYELPVNFPSWRFPPCHLFAEVVNANNAQMKQLWQEKSEFTVEILKTDGNVCQVELVK